MKCGKELGLYERWKSTKFYVIPTKEIIGIIKNLGLSQYRTTANLGYLSEAEAFIGQSTQPYVLMDETIPQFDGLMVEQLDYLREEWRQKKKKEIDEDKEHGDAWPQPKRKRGVLTGTIFNSVTHALFNWLGV